MQCGEPHPDLDLECSKEEPCWGFHCDDESGEVWQGKAIPKSKAESDKLALVKIADRMKQ